MNAREQIDTQRTFLQREAHYRSKHLRTLQRRRDYLAQRIAEQPNDTAIDFLRGEKSALDWALEELTGGPR